MKKRTAIFILILSWLLSGCGGSKRPEMPAAAPTPSPTVTESPTSTPLPTPSPTPEPTPKPISAAVQALRGRNEEVAREIQTREWMAGRLVIASADIDVGLFVWGEGPDENAVGQRVTDDEDSALVYFDGIGYVVADHNNQDFATLNQVKVGDMAYILSGDAISSLRCDKVIDGINTGHGITDAEGTWATIGEDLICYTCKENWTNVLVVGFTQVDLDYFGDDPYLN
ncbi:MAG: hypothetical protein IJV41_08895 [Oscillospiraceae bacterium]|nr:hypothetical protein [Oscillospiraceae bacterium]